MLRRVLVLTVSLLCSSGCIRPGWLTDGTSVSFGTHRAGALRGSAMLPARGSGYIIPQRWLDRERNFGTDELVRLIVRATRRVRAQYPRSLLGVGDLSPRRGGPTPEHGSHRSGRDVDLIYYVTDAMGNPVVPEEMIDYDRHGNAVPARDGNSGYQAAKPPVTTLPTTQNTASGPSIERSKPIQGVRWATPGEPRKLDIKRNWALVRALLTDPEVPVQWIFISRHIKGQLLRYGKKSRQPKALLARAALVLHQPGDSSPHTDHCHIRIFCAPSDRQQGCSDRGPGRWMKKELKYKDTPATGAPLWGQLPSLQLGANPVHAL